jgi:hypothetical protein
MNEIISQLNQAMPFLFNTIIAIGTLMTVYANQGYFVLNKTLSS